MFVVVREIVHVEWEEGIFVFHYEQLLTSNFYIAGFLLLEYVKETH